ncbi:hypothetical protein GMA48_00025 [Turicibacter sanguinis]|nr:hypothetical protein [Turicibacter sanguinis]MTK74071.1 hypothetical protein [Turicibacter sanguinis]MTL05396.1 hypothetical protein [Turicibacter sanguinis]
MKQFLKINSKFYFWIISSWLLTFIIEFIAFPSSNLDNKLLSITPQMFFLNLLVVLVITVIIFFVRRYLTTYSIIASILILLAITNRMLIVFRGSPFTYSDFSSLVGGVDIFDRYLNVETFMLIIIILLVYICLTYLLFKIEARNKNKVNYKKEIINRKLYNEININLFPYPIFKFVYKLLPSFTLYLLELKLKKR